MNNLLQSEELSGDLFGAVANPRRSPLVARRIPLELKVAGVLCRQIRRQQAPRDKRRIAHLICLNLLSMLKHRR
jgi:hypothetical protein